MVSMIGITDATKSFYNYGKRFLNTAPELVLGTAADAAGEAMRGAKGSLFDKAAAGWHALEKAGQGSFFKSFIGNMKSFIPDMKVFIKEGAKDLTGFAKIKGGTKGLFKGLGKKMPFIGAVLMVVTELPNIWKATKEQGILAGATEVVKSGARLIGGGIGSAVGSAICPGLGSMAGWLAGEWLVGRIVGKSYSEKKAEAEQKVQEEAQQNQQQTQTPQAAPTSYTYPPQGYTYPQQTFGNSSAFNNPYQNDIFMNQLPFNTVA